MNGTPSSPDDNKDLSLSAPGNTPSKSALRRELRAARQGRGRRQRQADAALLNRNLLRLKSFGAAKWVAGYLAFDGEPDIRFSLTQLCRRGTGVALPVLPEAPGERLSFHRWTPATPLRVNRYGISEPRDGERISLDLLEVILLPLVAFDRKGNRLGMGAGWYDRTVNHAECTAARIGVAWSQQEVPRVPLDPWDQALDAVVTETEWFTCPP